VTPGDRRELLRAIPAAILLLVGLWAFCVLAIATLAPVPA
jgi:hypothetical protein